MDTKHIHCMLEKIAEYGKQMMEEAVGAGNVNLEDAGKIVDMVKDLACAEKDALIAKEMRKANEEDEAEEKYIRKMLKEENKDEYKRMREEYGEEEADRRFYDAWRYKSSGRYAPKGKGTYVGRRGYEEPPYYHMTPEEYAEHSPEWYRDMDRRTKGVMYFSSPTSGNMGGGNSSGSSGNSGNGGGSTRSYIEGFNDGQSRGYSEGYERGRSDGGRNNSSRYDNARRGYSESKQKNKGNSPEENAENMKKLEEVLNTIKEDIQEYIPQMSTSERAMAKQKIDSICKMIQ